MNVGRIPGLGRSCIVIILATVILYLLCSSLCSKYFSYINSLISITTLKGSFYNYPLLTVEKLEHKFSDLLKVIKLVLAKWNMNSSNLVLESTLLSTVLYW